jgi:acetyl-CoA C-acetyltransferase/acetyl-CoA acyltransferase
VDGIRTPFCKAGTLLAEVDAVTLGKTVVQALLTRTGLDPAAVDEVIFGCVCQPPDAANIARIIALRSGIPQEKTAFTVQRNCASGMEAVTTAAMKIAAGHGEVFVAGGVESMSQAPLLFPACAAPKFAALQKAKSLRQRMAALCRFRRRDFAPRSALMLGLTDPVAGMNMGQTAELLAQEFRISREQQDAFALRSHQRAAAAAARLAEEITPVFAGENFRPVSADNGVRADTSLEALRKLNPSFDRAAGTVTPGNASQISDGAVALLVASERRAEALGLKPLGRLVSCAYTGCDPARMGLGPVTALQEAAAQAGMNICDADLVEINEAFAAQILAVLKSLPAPIPDDRLNVNGGAIALGHPVGASGARLILTALKELHRRGASRALVSLCIGGGQGAAACLERIPA